MRAPYSLLAAGFLLLAAPIADAALPWGDLHATTVLDRLNGPIDFAIAPDGAIWWNEYYTGDVTRYDPADGSRRIMFHADPIENGVERGLVGLALDPNVVENEAFYVYYTVADPENPDGGTNRLSRIEGSEETILLTLSAAIRHNGGRILVAPDGSLFVSTGENELGAPAQDPNSFLGKILHVMPDGSPAAGNIKGAVYSVGHRNVYGLAYDTEKGRLFATENGNAERDEVNLVEAGKNYGWPMCEGHVRFDFAKGTDTDLPCDEPGLAPPIGEFYTNRTAAPTGATYLDGVLYWASWNEGGIHAMVETADGWTDEVVWRPGHRINDLETADGVLYLSNWTHILRLENPKYTPGAPLLNPVDDLVGAEPQRTPALGAVVALAVALAVAARRR